MTLTNSDSTPQKPTSKGRHEVLVVEIVNPEEPSAIVEEPGYRITVWRDSAESFSSQASSWAVTGADDALEVINWAVEKAEGSRVAVFIEQRVSATSPADGQVTITELVRIYGSGPEAAASVVGESMKTERI